MNSKLNQSITVNQTVQADFGTPKALRQGPNKLQVTLDHFDLQAAAAAVTRQVPPLPTPPPYQSTANVGSGPNLLLRYVDLMS